MKCDAEDQAVNLTEVNFAETIARSHEVPVLVDFWADWCAPCKQVAVVLDKIAVEMKGRFILAKVNADKEPLVTQQFGVRGLPTLKLVWKGQLVDELVGAHPETAIRKLLQPFVSAVDDKLDDEVEPGTDLTVLSAIQEGRIEEAMLLLSTRLAAAGDDHQARVMLVELLLQEGRLDEAQGLLDEAPADAVAEFRRPRSLLAFARRTEGLPSLSALTARAAAGEQDTGLRFERALRLVTANRIEEGLDELLDILRYDRSFGEDAARKALLEILEMLGREDPLVAPYRRRMANYLL